MLDSHNYRIIPRDIGRYTTDIVLIVQKKGRGMTYSGMVEDVWYDCKADDVTDAVLSLFNKGEK